jgi:hypothetical protein
MMKGSALACLGFLLAVAHAARDQVGCAAPHGVASGVPLELMHVMMVAVQSDTAVIEARPEPEHHDYGEVRDAIWEIAGTKGTSYGEALHEAPGIRMLVSRVNQQTFKLGKASG